MNTFEKETKLYRNHTEGAETSAETKEKQTEAAEKKMAARERIEQTSKEIKTTKNQIQNIVANMQQVIQAVQAIRAQLQLSSDGDIPSVQQDQKTLVGLRNKLDTLYGEIGDLKIALLVEERKSVQEDNGNWSAGEIQQEADRRVREILEKLGVFERDV